MSPVWRQAVVLGLGQAEVGDPDDARGVQQQVRRLDVAVDDAAGVGVGQPLRRLAADLGHAPEERLPTAARARPRDLAARPAARPRGPDVGRRGRAAAGSAIREHEVRGVAASRSSRSVAAGPVAASGRHLTGGTALRSPAGRSGAIRRPGRASGFRRRRPAVCAGRGPHRGHRVACRDFPSRPRSRPSSSMTWSSPWPWMNCMA